MILEMTRGHIRYRHASDRVVTIGVEGLVPGHGGPDFVMNTSSMTRWDPPFHDFPLTEADRASILAALGAELTGRGITFALE